MAGSTGWVKLGKFRQSGPGAPALGRGRGPSSLVGPGAVGAGFGADLLGQKMDEPPGINVWLVNTG
ncbi:MAG: hypothetical protein ACRYFR_15810 [Janthinobacterium lividum]